MGVDWRGLAMELPPNYTKPNDQETEAYARVCQRTWTWLASTRCTSLEHPPRTRQRRGSDPLKPRDFAVAEQDCDPNVNVKRCRESSRTEDRFPPHGEPSGRSRG